METGIYIIDAQAAVLRDQVAYFQDGLGLAPGGSVQEEQLPCPFHAGAKFLAYEAGKVELFLVLAQGYEADLVRQVQRQGVDGMFEQRAAAGLEHVLRPGKTGLRGYRAAG
ncbi:MAG: hypothetical protein UY72_C0001G0027, partial [Candidatus Uhrbacteria bacterium GW2011_GWD2_52_7]